MNQANVHAFLPDWAGWHDAPCHVHFCTLGDTMQTLNEVLKAARRLSAEEHGQRQLVTTKSP